MPRITAADYAARREKLDPTSQLCKDYEDADIAKRKAAWEARSSQQQAQTLPTPQPPQA